MSVYTDLKDVAVRDMLRRELAKRGGNRSRTARDLGIERTFLLGLIRRYGA